MAVEGKLWETLRLLMFRPGRLTADYLRGRRVPTINPLRLYLSLSVLVFALIKLNGVDLPRLALTQKSFAVEYVHNGPDPTAPRQIGTVTLALTVEETEDGALYAVREGMRAARQPEPGLGQERTSIHARTTCRKGRHPQSRLPGEPALHADRRAAAVRAVI